MKLGCQNGAKTWILVTQIVICTEDSQKYLHGPPYTVGVTLSRRSSFIHSFIQAVIQWRSCLQVTCN